MTQAKTKINNRIKKSTGDKITLTINFILLTLFLVIIAYPLLFVLFSSFNSDNVAVMSLNILPTKWSLAGYKAVLEYNYFWIGYKNSLIYVVLSTAVSLFVTTCCAYALSRDDFAGGKVMMVLCMITMYFGGGLIPTYLMMRSLKLLDTVWVLVLPGALSVYNMIVMRTFFRTSIPDELREAAYLDGCGDLRYLIRIVLPLSGAILAVISLYVAVGTWNSYFSALIYIRTRSKYPLSIFLREILVVNSTDLSDTLDVEELDRLLERQRVMKYCVIVVSALPVMVLYPFLQKYFVKGVMIGSVKG